MSPEDLDAIEARAAAATAGPWRSAWWDDLEDDVDPYSVDSVYSVSDLVQDKDVCGVQWYDGHLSGCREPDAAFIAHAREDVPTLVGEVRRQAALLERCKAAIDLMGWATVGDNPNRWDMEEVLGALMGLCQVAKLLEGGEDV